MLNYFFQSLYFNAKLLEFNYQQNSFKKVQRKNIHDSHSAKKLKIQVRLSDLGAYSNKVKE